MNGWAKCAGIISIIAGIVFFIAIALALSDGLTLEEGVRLSAYLVNDKFEQVAIIASLILFVAAITAVAAGVSSKKCSVSIAGASFAVLGIILLINVLNNVTAITERSVEYDFLGAFFFLAFAVLIMGVEKRRYVFSVIAVILGVALYALYLIALLGGMVTVFLGIILLILAGVAVAVPAKLTAAEIEAAAAKQAECDDLLEQAWNAAAAKVGEDKLQDMSDEEIMAVVREADEDLYNKVSEATGLNAAYTHTAVSPEESAAAQIAAEAAAKKAAAEEAEAREAAAKAAKEEELNKLLEQGWNVATAKVGDEAEDMSDEEIMAVIRKEDEDLYNKIAEATGLRAAVSPEEEAAAKAAQEAAAAKAAEEAKAKAEAEEAAKKAAEEEAAKKAAEEEAAKKAAEEEAAKKAAEEAAAKEAAAKEEAAKKAAEEEAAKKAAEGAKAAEAAAAAGAAAGAAVFAGAAAAAAKDEPAEEESELDRLLRQGWEVTVAEVGEERAEEMSDYEIMAVISVVDPPLYEKLSALTGIVVSTGDEPEGEMAGDEDFDDDDFELEPDTPAALLRRACWNKGLRCRKNYGPYFIPVAFVKSKVAVYIDEDTPDHSNDEVLAKKGWIVLHFAESKITDGADEAQVVYDAVKENIRAMKKAKKSKAKKKR
ncbi:surface-anchored protein [methanogenic archaeon ISO4-H5]|nr:surface-anchored protein [methanogenic archaeon ISO4-H5]